MRNKTSDNGRDGREGHKCHNISVSGQCLVLGATSIYEKNKTSNETRGETVLQRLATDSRSNFSVY